MLARIRLLNRIPEAGDVDVCDNVEDLGMAIGIPQNQTAGAGRFAFHHNLGGRGGHGLNHGWIAGENPSQRIFHINDDRFSDQNVYRLSFRRCHGLACIRPDRGNRADHENNQYDFYEIRADHLALCSCCDSSNLWTSRFVPWMTSSTYWGFDTGAAAFTTRFAVGGAGGFTAAIN